MSFQKLLEEISRTAPSVSAPFMEAAQKWADLTAKAKERIEVASSTQMQSQPAPAPVRRGGRRDIHNITAHSQPTSHPSRAGVAGGSGSGSGPIGETVPPQHWVLKSHSEMRPEDWTAFRECFSISIIAKYSSLAQSRPPTANANAASTGEGEKSGLPSSLPSKWLTTAKAPAPLRCWDELPTDLAWLKNKLGAQFPYPTPVQMQAVTAALAPTAVGVSATRDELGNDLMAIAETGSGKTLAYAIPLLLTVLRAPIHYDPIQAARGPQTLIIVPGRELALQVERQVSELFKWANEGLGYQGSKALRCTHVVGGEDLEQQRSVLSNGLHCLVGTPGQLQKLLSRRYLSFLNTKFVVMDEADTMVEEEILDHLVTVLTACPAQRQTLLFSATMLPECERIANIYLRSSYFLVTVPYRFPTIEQRFVLLDAVASESGAGTGGIQDEGENGMEDLHPGKVEALREAVLHNVRQGHRTIVFVNSKRTCDALEAALSVLLEGQLAEESASIPVLTLHGGLDQQARVTQLLSFRSQPQAVLIATDILARGLDVPDVGLVVNFDMPRERTPQHSLVKYVHRIGRTGRGGKAGKALSFLVFNALLSELDQGKDREEDQEDEMEEGGEDDDDDDDNFHRETGRQRRKRGRNMLDDDDLEPEIEGPPDQIPVNGNARVSNTSDDRAIVKPLLAFLKGCVHPSTKDIPAALTELAAGLGANGAFFGAKLLL